MLIETAVPTNEGNKENDRTDVRTDFSRTEKMLTLMTGIRWWKDHKRVNAWIPVSQIMMICM